jgi:hypothetical protein
LRDLSCSGKKVNMHYRVAGNELTVTDGSGTELWRGQPEGHPVAWAESVPGSDDGIVLYEYYRPERTYGCFDNLVRVRPFGSVLWRAELPSNETDSYTAAEISEGALSAYSWSCYRVRIDLETGRITERVFSK